ncbi:endophilin-A isoform X1 [Phymastichus coffea]|uniref:endophilin-A isoform X1 n=1 Tax=Phymastichus coffea TaxID=108790 RepID=UPI00273BA0DF|nr:endophilin-A isoform X1 [Phymastichus coffea]XP_058803185.1 endophilin-A isoform X1 [Phymastichus coffea]XP_058803195.1 endophilin-A isoform X1 [Phymastichus coffea]XP_058803202.1 endophilin-A isoform X1 [Phymastichus coffea]
MAFAGLKKQINKANQYMTEKMGGAEGTKLDVDFVDMERKTDVTFELVEELQMKTKEFLQPNPTARAKMAAVKGISKLSGQAKASTYPQPEGILGDCMLHYGKKMGDDSIFGQSLIEMGDAMKQMADVKYSLDDSIKQNFLEPLHHLQTKDLKEVMHHRKKLQGRRLDFDCKRRRQAKDDEVRQAEEKFAESLHLAQMGMFNLLENDIEQVAQLATFSEALLEYHQQCTEILNVVCETLSQKKEEAASRPKLEFVPKTLADLHVDVVLPLDTINGTSRVGSPTLGEGKRSQMEVFPSSNQPPSSTVSPLPSPSKSPARSPLQAQKQPCCTALYDFEPENPGELGFKENDTIILLQRIDENWFEGSIDGRTGYFPVSYVNIVVPLP